jgi:hypothetical protein
MTRLESTVRNAELRVIETAGNLVEGYGTTDDLRAALATLEAAEDNLDREREREAAKDALIEQYGGRR